MDEHTARHVATLLVRLDDDVRSVAVALERTNRTIEKLRADMQGVQSFLLQHNTTVGELCERFTKLWCVKQGGGRSSVEIKAPQIPGQGDGAGGECEPMKNGNGNKG